MKIFLLILAFTIFGNNDCLFIFKRQISSNCVDSPCYNGGQCVQVAINLAYCACINDFTGSRCEIAPAGTTTKLPPPPTTTTNICAAGFCKNDGICRIVSSNLAYCECINGFTGTFCEIAPAGQTTTLSQTTTTLSKICSANPCQNGGTCVDLSSNLAFCQCPPEYAGSLCENLASTISSSTSSGITTIISDSPSTSTLSSESSSSTSGATSSNSQSSTSSETTLNTETSTTISSEISTTTPALEPCPSDFDICRNNGTCLYSESGIFCKCSLPYTGAFCQTENQFCDLNPCKNGGTCEQNSDNTGDCKCSEGYSGRTCNIKKCEETNPCQNSLVCLEIDDKFECLCKFGFTGNYCETKI